jgi:hypothetical protein
LAEKSAPFLGRGIDPQTLAGCFVESDISVVQVVHPKPWLAAMERMYR